jgi:hypothetical protein
VRVEPLETLLTFCHVIFSAIHAFLQAARVHIRNIWRLEGLVARDAIRAQHHWSGLFFIAYIRAVKVGTHSRLSTDLFNGRLLFMLTAVTQIQRELLVIILHRLHRFQGLGHSVRINNHKLLLYRVG